MRKNFKKIIMTLAIIMAVPSMAVGQTEKQIESWNRVINAIIKVESGGNPKAHNKVGDCCGILQITPILVKECNNILKNKKSNKRYTLQDRYDVRKSKEMFVIIQEHYNPEHNVEKAIKCWNSGFRKNYKSYSIGYYKKVMKNY